MEDAPCVFGGGNTLVCLLDGEDGSSKEGGEVLLLVILLDEMFCSLRRCVDIGFDFNEV